MTVLTVVVLSSLCSVTAVFFLACRYHRQVQKSRFYASQWQVESTTMPTPQTNSTASPSNRNNDKLLQSVTSQALWLSLIYINQVVWLSVGYIIGGLDVTNTTVLFCFKLPATLFLPLQGFLNAIVILRPLYLEWREAHPELTRWAQFGQVVCGRHPSFISQSSRPEQTPPRPPLPATDPHGRASSPSASAIESKHENHGEVLPEAPGLQQQERLTSLCGPE